MTRLYFLQACACSNCHNFFFLAFHFSLSFWFHLKSETNEKAQQNYNHKQRIVMLNEIGRNILFNSMKCCSVPSDIILLVLEFHSLM